MKESSIGFYLVLGVFLALAGGFVAWLIGGAVLRIALLVFVAAAGLALVIGAAALPIRAWRRNDNPPVIERHFHHDGATKVIERQHTIDGRPQQVLLPGAAQQTNIYPEFMRAAWQAGLLDNRRAGADATGADLDASEPGEDKDDTDNGWGGTIRPHSPQNP